MSIHVKKYTFIFFQILIIVAVVVVVSASILWQDVFTDILDKYYKAVQLVLWLVGFGVALSCYRNYISNKQHDAVFGFYVNMQVYLRRLKIFMGNNANNSIVFNRLLTKDIYKSKFSDSPPREQIEMFAELSRDFLRFLSISKDNIPPTNKKHEFLNWYAQQIVLVELLQQAAALSETTYGKYNSDTALNEFYNRIIASIDYLNKEIADKIKKDAGEL